MIIAQVFLEGNKSPMYCLTTNTRDVCLSELHRLVQHSFKILDDFSDLRGVIQLVDFFYYQVYHAIHSDSLLEYSARIIDSVFFNRDFEPSTDESSFKNDFFKTLCWFELFLRVHLRTYCEKEFKVWDGKTPVYSEIFAKFFENKAQIIDFYNQLSVTTRVIQERNSESEADFFGLIICSKKDLPTFKPGPMLLDCYYSLETEFRTSCLI